ncbi:MAG: hypothetical protein OEM02_11335, partial [Desulfobulbaceae bacterium]|nr:hypothetical protein [Desulfobulbaceae bacterium]
ENAQYQRHASEIPELNQLLEKLSDETAQGTTLYRCRRCNLVWEEWVQYVYNGEVYLFAPKPQSTMPSLNPKTGSCARGAFLGALSGLFIGFLTLPPLPADKSSTWPTILRPLSKEALQRSEWVAYFLLAGMACGFALCRILRRR